MEILPSGRTVTTGYNTLNQPNSVSGTLSGAGTNYVTSATYAAHGAPSQVWLGNTLVDNYAYNSRLQPTNLWTNVNNNGGNTFLWYVLNWGSTDNNGNLQSMDEYNGGLPVYPTWLHFNQSYLYDGVNRLSYALETSQRSCSPAANYACWFRTFQYDNRGNIWVPSVGTGGIAPAATMPSSNVYTANNQIQATPYDAAGNQLVIGATALTYDAENRQTSATNPPAYGGGTVFYRYDGQGQRVQKVMDSGITTYVYDIFGKLSAEYTNFPNPTPACSTCYLTRDHLGSTRMVTDQAANLISRHDYLPFGEEITAGNVSRDNYFGRQDFVKGLFTGQTSDSETQLDFFNARYFSAAQGRFNSPDPANAGADLFNPQSWNGYGYVRNNPLTLIDPTGTCASAVATNYDPQCQDGPWEQSNGSLAYQGGFADPFQVQGIPVKVLSYVPGQAPQPTYLRFPSGTTSATITFGTPPGSWQWTSAGTLGDYDVPVGIDIWQGQQQLWTNTAGVGNALGVATAGVSALPAIIPAASAAGDAALTGLNRALLGPLTNRIFWSGGTAAMLKAMELANESGGSTLEMSVAGRLLTALKGFGNPFWSTASRIFAQAAVGPVSVVQGPVLRVTSTWGTVEYPQLLGKNPFTYIGIGW